MLGMIVLIAALVYGLTHPSPGCAVSSERQAIGSPSLASPSAIPSIPGYCGVDLPYLSASTHWGDRERSALSACSISAAGNYGVVLRGSPLHKRNC
jgi:hypothetical protein